MVGDTLETRREYLTKEKGRRERKLPFCLEISRVKEGVRDFQVAIEGGHHKLPRDSECGDFPQQW